MSPEELELLQSTVAINQYLSAEKQGRSWLIWNIKSLLTAGNSLFIQHCGPRLKNQATDIFASLSVIRDSIRKKKKLRILYGRYDKNLELAPTSEDARTIEPYAVMSSNGYYYLIAGNPKYPDGLTNFRIDRILQIQMLDEPENHCQTPFFLIPGTQPMKFFRPASTAMTIRSCIQTKQCGSI